MRFNTTASAMLVLFGLAPAYPRFAAAQDIKGFDTAAPATDIRPADNDYASSNYAQPSSYEANARQVVQQLAAMQAEQRSLRMASTAWYGMSNSRPTASVTPFAGRYSPVWEMPGGRPFSWYNFNRPTYLIYR